MQLPSKKSSAKEVASVKLLSRDTWIIRGLLFLGIALFALIGHFFIHGIHWPVLSSSIASITGRVFGVYVMAQIPCLLAKKENYWNVFFTAAYIMLFLAMFGEYSRYNSP